MSLKIATLVSILGIVSAFLHVRSGVDAQIYRKQEIDINSVEHTSSTGCPSTDEMNRNAAVSGLTEAEIDALEEVHQQNGGITAEPIIRERMPDGEIIYESRAVQTMTFTDSGVVRCSSFGNESIADSLGEIMYIGGPLDNQEK